METTLAALVDYLHWGLDRRSVSLLVPILRPTTHFAQEHGLCCESANCLYCVFVGECVCLVPSCLNPRAEPCEGGVTYSTDGTCLSWVWRESSILWGVEGGTSGGGAVLYMYLELVWRVRSGSLCVRLGTTVCQSVPT